MVKKQSRTNSKSFRSNSSGLDGRAVVPSSIPVPRSKRPFKVSMVPCPDCKAPETVPCVSREDKVRATPHISRVRIATRQWNNMTPEEQEALLEPHQTAPQKPANQGKQGKARCALCESEVTLKKRTRGLGAPIIMVEHQPSGARYSVIRGDDRCSASLTDQFTAI